MMNEFDELSDMLFDSSPPPPELADLVLASQKRRTRKRAGTTAVIFAIALPVTGLLLPLGKGPTDIAATGSHTAQLSSSTEGAVLTPSQSTTELLGSAHAALSEDCAVPQTEGSSAVAEDVSAVMALSPEELDEVASQISLALGGQLTGMYRDASGIVVTGIAAQEPAGLAELGGQFGISVSYQQVGESQADLQSASQWLTDLMIEQLGEMDLRTSYVDPKCGAVVAIVGTQDAAGLIRDRIAADGVDNVFLILIRPDYVVALRGG